MNVVKDVVKKIKIEEPKSKVKEVRKVPALKSFKSCEVLFGNEISETQLKEWLRYLKFRVSFKSRLNNLNIEYSVDKKRRGIPLIPDKVSAIIQERVSIFVERNSEELDQHFLFQPITVKLGLEVESYLSQLKQRELNVLGIPALDYELNFYLGISF